MVRSRGARVGIETRDADGPRHCRSSTLKSRASFARLLLISGAIVLLVAAAVVQAAPNRIQRAGRGMSEEARTAKGAADLMFIHGDIYTVDSQQPRAQAV